MSERREKKNRYNQRPEYIAAFNKWLDKEPPRMFFFSWHRWKKRRPVWKGGDTE
ncbi:MAG: hypothetical protein IKO68_08355 [Oscillospiraceae bacterium]|nr:hypothetical protein [Oscillospiraceae bacterium]